MAVPTGGARADNRWSRFTEFLLVGGATVFVFPLAWMLRSIVGLDRADFTFGFLAFYGAYVINDPHFSVTYLLFYRDARRRAFGVDYGLPYRIRYLLAGVAVPLGLVTWAAFALALRSAGALGWMIQLMYLLVGWHYAKQAFGVLTVLSGRRGARFTPRERTIILVHCYAAWAFAWANPAVAAAEFEEKGVVYRALAHPRWLEIAAGTALALSTAVLALAVAAKWRRDRRSLPVAPLTVFLISVWSWTIYTSVDPLVQYVIPALHSIQYLYFVWLMRRNEARAEEGPPRFGRPAPVRLAALSVSALSLGWLLFRGAPSLLDAAFAPHPRRGVAPGALGPTPFFAAFFVVVNIHHYFMDAVIWRRENPDTRHLQAAPTRRFEVLLMDGLPRD